jgi:hypothetical protein
MDLPITNATESKTRRLRRISSLRLLSALQALAVLTLGEPSFAADPPNGLSGSFGESAGSAQVVPSSGAMTYGVPFVLPRGRGNAQPSLAIQYRSGAPSGEAGLGWSLNLPQIERAPLSGWPKYIDDGNPMTEDRYAFNGQPLTFVCVVGGTPACPMNEQVGPMPTWAEGFRHYRLQVEGSFERFFLSPDRRTWMVQRRGGEIMEFGAPRTRADLAGPALDIEWSAGTFRWNLVRQYDLHGARNLIVYRWDAQGTQRQHLRDIFYTPPATQGSLAPTDTFAYHVALSWEAPPNAQPQYTHADKRRHELRLRRVAIASKTWAASGQRELVRAYNLSYFPARSVPGAAGEAPVWGRSSLKSVTVEGRCATPIAETAEVLPDPTGCPTLPPMAFDYQSAQLATGVAVHTAVNGPGAANTLEYVTSTALVDINRDGLPDLVQAWPANYRRPSYKFEYNSCTKGDFIVDAGADPSTHDPQLACNPDDGDIFDIRPARQHDAWINRKTGFTTVGFDHRCLDAGGVEPNTLTYFQVAGPHGYGSREPSLFTQYGAEAMGDWGDSAMLWSLAGYAGFGFAPAVMDVPNGPMHEEGYAPDTFIKFCPQGASNPFYPALRWKKIGTAEWAKDAPGQGVPEARNYTHCLHAIPLPWRRGRIRRPSSQPSGAGDRLRRPRPRRQRARHRV